jgi:hypothetical protein
LLKIFFAWAALEPASSWSHSPNTGKSHWHLGSLAPFLMGFRVTVPLVSDMVPVIPKPYHTLLTAEWPFGERPAAPADTQMYPLRIRTCLQALAPSMQSPSDASVCIKHVGPTSSWIHWRLLLLVLWIMCLTLQIWVPPCPGYLHVHGTCIGDWSYLCGCHSCCCPFLKHWGVVIRTEHTSMNTHVHEHVCIGGGMVDFFSLGTIRGSGLTHLKDPGVIPFFLEVSSQWALPQTHLSMVSSSGISWVQMWASTGGLRW